jgi:hypothetical protein
LGDPTHAPKSSINAGASVIDQPVVFQSCNFKGVNQSLVYAGTVASWGVKDMRIIDCIVELNNATSKPVINFENSGGRAIKDLTVQKSTFYNLQFNSSGRFIRMNNASNAQPKKTWTSASGSISITNCTYYRVMSNKEFANNVASTADVTITLQNNIFMDTWRLQKMMGSCTKVISGNFLWANAIEDQVGALDSKDATYGTVENPQFAGPLDKDPDAVNFAPASSTAAYSAKAGDPRWLN